MMVWSCWRKRRILVLVFGEIGISGLFKLRRLFCFLISNIMMG